MQIVVNGEPEETEARTLAELCAERGPDGMRFATAVNGEFVPAEARAETALKAGDRVEIVSPRQGG